MNKKIFLLLGGLVLLCLFLFISFSHSTPTEESPDTPGEELVETVPNPDPAPDQGESGNETEEDPKTSGTQNAPDNSGEDKDDTGPSSEEVTAGQARVDAIIGEIYALRSSYVGQLAAIEASAVSQYQSLPADKKSESAKQSIASSCISQANALERQCDAQMNRLCSELGQVLLEIDGDLTLVNEARHTYVAEKAAKKSAFLSAYSSYM